LHLMDPFCHPFPWWWRGYWKQNMPNWVGPWHDKDFWNWEWAICCKLFTNLGDYSAGHSSPPLSL
jgi:hypothetical protein